MTSSTSSKMTSEAERTTPSRQFENLRGFMNTLFERPIIASHIGNRESTQAQQVIAGMDFNQLAGNNIQTEVLSAITTRDPDAMMDVMERAVYRVISDNKLRTEIIEWNRLNPMKTIGKHHYRFKQRGKHLYN